MPGVKALLAEGFEVVQEGRVIDKAGLGKSFADRVEGFDIKLLGRYGPPTWRSEFDNYLIESDDRWVHLRRRRDDA